MFELATTCYQLRRSRSLCALRRRSEPMLPESPPGVSNSISAALWCFSASLSWWVDVALRDRVNLKVGAETNREHTRRRRRGRSSGE